MTEMNYSCSVYIVAIYATKCDFMPNDNVLWGLQIVCGKQHNIRFYNIMHDG